MLDVPPEMESLPLDRPDPEANAAGAKGLGELDQSVGFAGHR